MEGTAALPADDSAFEGTARLARSSYYRWFLLIGTVLVLSLLAATVTLIWMQRNATIEGEQTAVSHLGNAMLQQTSQLFGAADQVIHAIEDDLTPAGDATPEWIRLAIKGQASADLMNSLIRGSSIITGLAVADANGLVRNWSGQWVSSAYDLSDRDLFAHFSATDDRGTYVSKPAKNDLNGKWSAFLSRRINNVDGAFAGVVVAEISLDAIETFYSRMLPIGRSVSLVHVDGSILIRLPHHEREIGRKIPSRAAWNEAVAHDGNIYRDQDFFAPTRILAFARPLGNLPLIVQVAVAEDELPARWPLLLLCALVGAAAALIGVVMLSRYLAHQIDRVEQSRLALAHNNAELETARFQLDVALANISLGVVFFSGDRKLILSNDKYREIYDLPVNATQRGMPATDVMDQVYASDHAPRLGRDEYMSARDTMTARGGRHEMVVELKSGHSVLIIHRAMPDGGWLSTHEDITERRRADNHIRYLAHNDVLTGLCNRASFTDKLDGALNAQRRGGGQLAVFMMDLDGFKHVNDTLGHLAGDQLLRETAQRLKSSIRDSDVLARLGGDEFAVIQVGGHGSQESAASLAARMIAIMNEPFNIDGKMVSVGASIGIALTTENATVSFDLLRMADLALYAVKSSGRNNFCFFQDEMLASYNERREMEYQLRLAISQEEFELHYQALVDVNTGRRAGFEALVRWNRPDSGLVPPDKFIPLAEETGLIVPLGEWILRRACTDAVGWPDNIKVAVNLSPVQLAHPGLFESIQRVLAETTLPARRLELEITETALFKNNADCETLIRKLKELGISIALDDFGTGYSSLSYLTMIPFDKIKIDRSFTMNMTERADCAAIVAAVVALGHNLNTQTVAEGVETEEHLAILRAAGVTLVQGYLFGKPCPLSAMVMDDISKQHLFASAA
jgi:diguanylate cyclase (GGDEF)-like protein